jgi:hypothetical protein
VSWEGPTETPRPLVSQMEGAESAWREIAQREGLIEPDIGKLASWWHSDSDLGREIECFTDMTKSREAGFLNFRNSVTSFFDKVGKYRDAKILP